MIFTEAEPLRRARMPRPLTPSVSFFRRHFRAATSYVRKRKSITLAMTSVGT
jgi:hypothetical protein